jgi:hypothetical protein
MMGDVVDMVPAVGEEDEAVWLRSLNFCGLLDIFSEGLSSVGGSSHAMEPKKNDSKARATMDLKSRRATVGLEINTPQQWFEIHCSERRQGKLQCSGMLRTWKVDKPHVGLASCSGSDPSDTP